MELENSKLTELKSRMTIDFTKDVDAQQVLDSFLKKINDKSYGKKLNSSHVFSHALSKLRDEDVVIIQEKNLTKGDLLQKKYKEHLEKTKEDISYEDFIFRNLKTKLQ